jgi:hypothetical protein
MAVFRIRDLETLEDIIFPIFDNFPLLTSKEFNYIKFKKAHSIITSKILTKSQKDTKLLEILNSKLPDGYISSA